MTDSRNFNTAIRLQTDFGKFHYMSLIALNKYPLGGAAVNSPVSINGKNVSAIKAKAKKALLICLVKKASVASF